MTFIHRLEHAPLEHDPYYGMQPALYALVFGILSGSSLPVASCLGIALAPVHDAVCALMMAFGAGALLFAVTVELYGHALHEVAVGHLGLQEFFTIIIGALFGGAFYLTVNQWLEEYLCKEEESPAETSLKDSTPNKTDRVVTFGEDVEIQHKLSTDSLVKSTPLMTPTESSPLMYDIASIRSARSTMSLGGQAPRLRGREKAFRAALTRSLSVHDLRQEQHAKSVAFALFLGLLVDGVPEGVLMGFLAAEGHLTPVLIISLFVANFPEAFSSASLLIQARMHAWQIIGMWTGLCALVGCLAGLSCWLLLLSFPEYGQPGVKLPLPVSIGCSLVEGITGGAMIACIAAVMLPEAFERAGKTGPFYTQSGFLCLSGFLLSASLKALFG